MKFDVFCDSDVKEDLTFVEGAVGRITACQVTKKSSSCVLEHN